jgi:hypothetical protein
MHLVFGAEVDVVATKQRKGPDSRTRKMVTHYETLTLPHLASLRRPSLTYFITLRSCYPAAGTASAMRLFLLPVSTCLWLIYCEHIFSQLPAGAKPNNSQTASSQ